MLSQTVRKSSPLRTTVSSSADYLHSVNLSAFTYMSQLCFGSILDLWSGDCSLLIKETVICITIKTNLVYSLTAGHLL